MTSHPASQSPTLPLAAGALPKPVATHLETLEPKQAREMAHVLGLTPAEFENVLLVQGRYPSLTELYIYSLMWSEHCSYKHSKKQLRRFKSDGPRVLQGPGENAGVVSVGDGWAVAFKMESHNHPSAIEPFEGAATGVGGIIRDIFTMGARPIASLNSLRFGSLEEPRQRYLFDGAVAGIGSYGNCLGVPTVGGEVFFENAYGGNCLINAMAVGLMRESELIRAVGSGPGNHVVLLGSSTGRDGIGGASVLASQEFDEAAENKRPAVQVGDPFEEKLLIEVCLELLKRGRFVALGDLGAAGLTSSAAEMACRGGVGIDLDVGQVPQRESNMQPFEIMVSESQERMLAVVKPKDWQSVQATCQRWQIACTIIGSITDSGRFVVRDSRLPTHANIVADMPAAMLAESAPEYDPPRQRPAWLDELQGFDLDGLLRAPPRLPAELRWVSGETGLGFSVALDDAGLDDDAGLNDASSNNNFEAATKSRLDRDREAGAAINPGSELDLRAEKATNAGSELDLLTQAKALLASPNICSRAWIWRQYDHQVLNNTVVLPGADAAVMRIGDTGRGAMSQRGIALSTDCNGRYCYLDPYRGAQLALAEATRNLACVGAEPIAITDCLNFGNPEKPEVFYTFEQAVRGLADACSHWNIPVVSGNVSFYNESFGNAIYPTPIVGALGVLSDVALALSAGFKNAGDVVILIGTTLNELGGSEYLQLFYGRVVGQPPALDSDLEQAVQGVTRAAIAQGLLASAHDCSEGGIFVALAESCILGGLGASITLDGSLSAISSLFSESASRIVTSCSLANSQRFVALLKEWGVPYRIVGQTGNSGGDTENGSRVRSDSTPAELLSIGACDKAAHIPAGAPRTRHVHNVPSDTQGGAEDTTHAHSASFDMQGGGEHAHNTSWRLTWSLAELSHLYNSGLEQALKTA
ncbi:MAG: phosphoribosylformylglycinamidine synthase subunit PurL [Coriobacteriales bacterium]|nr:phosphoribosylformylglycinamidine synthase subunit PurL [Coriobacteriales bacterium]